MTEQMTAINAAAESAVAGGCLGVQDMMGAEDMACMRDNAAPVGNAGMRDMTVVFKIHVGRKGRNSELREGQAPSALPSPAALRTPRITRFMALAIHLQKLLDDGAVRDYAHIAALSGLTRARITQIMNLNLLAPRIQEDILFLPKIARGSDPISEHTLRSIALTPRWDMQFKDWQDLTKNTGT